MYLGTSRIRTNTRIPPNSTISMMKVATIKPAKRPYTSSPLFWKRSGPGTMPWSIKPPRIIAVTVSPGIPKVRSGINAPPIDALLDVSEATIPPI